MNRLAFSSKTFDNILFFLNVDHRGGGIDLNIKLLQSVCQEITHALSNMPGLDRREQTELIAKINEIVSKAKNPETVSLIEKSLHTNDLAKVDKRKAKLALTSRVLITITDKPEVSSRMIKAMKDFFKTTITFTEPYNPAKDKGTQEHETAQLNKNKPKSEWSFLKLDRENLTPELIAKTFSKELLRLYVEDYGDLSLKGKLAISFLSKSFEEALDEMIEELTSGNKTMLPSQAVYPLMSRFYAKSMEATYKEMVSREEFRKLAGKLVDKHSKRLPSIDPNNPSCQKLAKAYKDGSWELHEEKELTLENISPEETEKCKPLLDDIFHSPGFDLVMMTYFRSLLEDQK